MLKAAFIFLAVGAVPVRDRSVVSTPGVQLTTVGVASYEEAADVAKQMLADGFGAIELCAGFGHRGVAMIAQAVEGKIPVGVVRFDIHPGLDNKSGDTVF